MSWWRLPGSGAQEQYMGDPLADTVTAELLELATARRERGERLPRAEALAAAIEVELGARPLRVGDAAVLSGRRVSASGLPPREPPADVREAVGRAIDEISARMHERFHRAPFVREVLYAFDFVVGASPEDYLGEPWPPDVSFALVEEPEGPGAS